MRMNPLACRAAGGEPPPSPEYGDVVIPYHVVRSDVNVLTRAVAPGWSILDDKARKRFVIYWDPDDV